MTSFFCAGRLSKHFCCVHLFVKVFRIVSLLFVFLLGRLHICLQIRDESAIGTQKVGPIGSVDQVSDTLVVPHVAAGRHEECLTRRYRVQADAALGRVDAGSVRIPIFGLYTRALQQPSVSTCVVRIQALLPVPVAFDPDLDAAEDHLFSALEVNAQLDHIAVVDWKWAALLVGRRKADVV